MRMNAILLSDNILSLIGKTAGSLNVGSIAPFLPFLFPSLRMKIVLVASTLQH